MKKRYADVIVDVSHEKLDRPFTYEVPPSLRESCVPGCVVRIPFGNGGRVIRGYAVGFREQTDLPPEKIRQILSVETDRETVESKLVALAAWISRNYGSTMLQALRTVVPVKRKYEPASETYASAGDPVRFAEILERAQRRHWAAQERTLLALPADGREIPVPELQKKAGVPASVVRKLAEDGALVMRTSAFMRRPVPEKCGSMAEQLSEEQKRAADAVREEWRGAGRPVLIRGVTGSGKTVVYAELIDDVLREGRQAIVLIPEIALTRQTVSRFVSRFGDRVSFLHSRLSGSERYDQMKAARNGEISVMVGPRSALFTPFPSLGLIIIDEEHEETYHSESVPRYHARETAVERGILEGAHVVMGSATPSVTAAFRAERGEYLGVALEHRYGGTLPPAEIVDMREELKRGNRSLFSGTLKNHMADALGRGEQIMLFLNRRGYSGAYVCRSCGHVRKCPHCDVALTHHRDGRMICHYCGYTETAPEMCPECGSPFIGGVSVGTEQVEEQVKEMFPDASVLRMDADTTKGKDGFGPILRAFSSHQADILIGTQMIVKGHDFPRVTLVGVLLADLSLNEQDYRSGEHTFQLIAQAVGRAGRSRLPGRAVIQTYRPDHFAVVAAAEQDYEAFYREEILFRRILAYPPAGAMAAVLGNAADETVLTQAMRFLRAYIDRIDPGGALHAIGPAPQTVGRIRDHYRQVIYIRHADREKLVRAKDLLEDYIEINSGFRKIGIQFDIT